MKKTYFVRPIFLAILWSQSLTTHANMVGVDMQNFNPSYGATDYTTVHSSRTLQEKQFHLGLFFDLAINSIVYYDSNQDVPQSRTDFNDHISSMEAHFAMGISQNWDVGVSIPFVLKQSVKQPGNRIQYFDTGIADIRISTKYRLWSNASTGVAAVASGSFNKVRNNPFTGEGSSRVFNVELVADHNFGNIKVAANIGYRYRTEGDPLPAYPIEPINNQLIGSLGVHHPLITNKLAFIGEIYGGKPLKSGRFDSDRSIAAGEVTAGVNYYPQEGLSIHTGLGTEMFSGLFTPDWRFFAGVNWTFPVHLPASAPKPQKFERITLQEVLFEYNSDSLLRGNYQKHLEVLNKALHLPSEFNSLTIEGHTCSLGSEDYNRDLSQRRANRIKEILVKDYGIPAEKITALGMGESQPVAENTSEEGRRRNRRVEFKIFRDE